jgi:PAS domain-containing protein
MAASNGGSSVVLDQLARTGEAVFARDADQRIVFWSRKCEEILGLPARSALGRRCHEVTGGRDRYGNVYCHRGCPIAVQARDDSDPVRRFPLRIETGRGAKWFDVGTFAIPSDHPSLSTLVHALRPGTRNASAGPDAAGGASDSSGRESLSPVTLRREQIAVNCAT